METHWVQHGVLSDMGRKHSNSFSSAVMIVSIMLLAGLSPAVAAAPADEVPLSIEITGDLSDFVPPIEGKQYMFTGEEEAVFSATGFLKRQWVEDGYPGVVLPFSQAYQNSRHSVRSCEAAWSQGDTDTISTASGTISATVQKVSTNSVVFVQDGEVVSSTTLNDITSTWESTIFPTDTNYFGSAPDVDNNCQIEIVILAIDGAASVGGYFIPGLASTREAVSLTRMI